MTEQAMIKFEDFSFRYEETAVPSAWALRGINMMVTKGEIVLVLGRSGCGKSTLGLALTGIVPHLIPGTTEGTVTAAGLSILDTSVFEIAKYAGIVFQDPELQLFALTVEDELAMSLESFGVPREQMRDRVEWAMSVSGITGMHMDAPSKLSGGQKQRVAIAAVLARDLDILVFDEATANLDPTSTRSVHQVIRDICVERTRTVVLIEHDLAPVVDFVDQVYVLEKGKIVFKGTPREVLSQVDLMHQAGAKVPVATELGLRLAKKNLVSYPQTPLLPEETAHPILQAIPSDCHPLLRVNHTDGSIDRSDAGRMQKEPIVSFQSVTYRYATEHVALNNVSLDIYPDEFVGIVGMNGAGKTTLALHVMGILCPTEGDVFVDGRNTRESSVAELARTVGLIFQNPNHQLFKDSVAGELRFGPENLGWEEDRIQASKKRVLELVHLQGTEQMDPESLSTGEKKRVAIASTLIMDPRVLLLDEPTTGQDQRTLGPILKLVTRLHHEGMTVLMITHDMEVAMRYASRIVVMARSEIIADGPPNEVFLRDDVLQQAGLFQPELLQMSAAIAEGKPFWVQHVDELEAHITTVME